MLKPRWAKKQYVKQSNRVQNGHATCSLYQNMPFHLVFHVMIKIQKYSRIFLIFINHKLKSVTTANMLAIVYKSRKIQLIAIVVIAKVAAFSISISAYIQY